MMIVFDLSYYSKEGVCDEKQEVQRNYKQNGEFCLHELSKETEFKEEGLPDQKEEPKYEAEMHDYLNTIHEDIIS